MKSKKNLISRALAILLVMVMCISMLPVGVFADELDEGDQPEPEVKVEVTVTKDEETGDLEVDGRPEATPGVDGETKYDNKGQENAPAKVEGSVTASTDEDETTTNGQGDPIHMEGTIEGEETITVNAPEEDVSPEEPETTAPVTDPLPLESNEIDFTFDGEDGFGKDDQKTKDQDNGDGAEVGADIKELVEAIRPQKPEGDGWNETEAGYAKTDGEFETDEDGVEVGTVIGTTWNTAPKKDGTGWTTETVETTTEKGKLTEEELKKLWDPEADGAEVDEDGNLVKTDVVTVGRDTITTTITYNTANGTYEKKTVKTTTEDVTVEEVEEGIIQVSGVNASIGDDNGTLKGLESLGPAQDIIDFYKRNESRFKNEKGKPVFDTNGLEWNGEAYVDSVTGEVVAEGWLAKHLIHPFSHKGEETEALRFFESVVRSSLFIDTANGEGQVDGQAMIRGMKDKNGNYVYVYCVQHEVKDNKNVDYDISNVEDGNYFNLSKEDLRHIQYIAEHGYWGTSSGVGSLAEVQKLIAEEYQGYITDGIAIAVTQAALWYYGNDDGAAMFEKDGELIDIFTQCYNKSTLSSVATTGKLESKEQEAAMALFKALIKKGETIADAELKSTTDIISQEDIKGTSISVDGKVTADELDKLVADLAAKEEKSADEVAQLKKAERDKSLVEKYQSNAELKDKDLYKTDLSLTVAVVPGEMNATGDGMMIYVYVDGVEGAVASVKLNKDAETADGKVKIEIPGVVLPEGVKITLNLSGTQNLTEGAYMFRSDVDYSKSQTMVGYVKDETASRSVDLNVNMTFNVTDPEVEETTEVTATQTVEQTSTWNWSESWEQDYSYYTPPEDPEDPEDPSTPPEDPNTPPEEEIPELEIPLAEMPIDEMPEEEIELDEPDIPLADIPATGDISLAWYAVASLSACGLAALSVSKKKEQEI